MVYTIDNFNTKWAGCSWWPSLIDLDKNNSRDVIVITYDSLIFLTSFHT